MSSLIFLNQNKIYEIQSCKSSKSSEILGKKKNPVNHQNHRKSWARKKNQMPTPSKRFIQRHILRRHSFLAEFFFCV